MAHAHTSGWCVLGGRHYVQAFCKWKKTCRIQSRLYNSKPSKLPNLMRYIPKEARKANSERLERVRFPQKHFDNNKNEEHEYSSLQDSDSDSDTYRGITSVSKRSELAEAIAAFRKQNPPLPSSYSACEGLEKNIPKPNIPSKEDIAALNLVPASQITSNQKHESRRVPQAKEKPKPTSPEVCAGERLAFDKFEMEDEEFTSEHESEEFDDDDDMFMPKNEEQKTPSASNSPGDISSAKNYSIFLLGQWQRSSSELKKKLSAKNYSPQVIESTLRELKQEGLQSDTSYAEVFAQSRWNSKGWGPKRIKYELIRKGIDMRNIERALKRVFNTDSMGNINEDIEETRWGMSKEAEEHILLLASKKWKCGGNITVDTRNRRLAGWLQRRGFSWKVINGIINTVQGSKTTRYGYDEWEDTIV